MNQTISNAIILVLGGFLAWALFFREPATTIREINVPVQLTPKQLDSIGLSIREKLKGEIKPIVLPPKKIVDSASIAKRDSTIKRQLGEILSLRDSLKGNAKLNLEWHGEIGENKDTLDVVADMISDTISVVFRPKQRNFEVVYRDTVVGRNFFERLRIGAGVGATIQDGKVAMIPSIGLFYDIFGK